MTEKKNNVDEYEICLKLDLDSGYELYVKIKSLLRNNPAYETEDVHQGVRYAFRIFEE